MRGLTRTALIVVVVLTICTSLASPARAWDHKRKGFILGGALGGMGIYDSIDGDGFGWLAGDVKIGYAPSDRLAIYYTSRNVLLPGLMGGLSFGANYYMKPEARSLFLTAGGGAFGGTYPFAFIWYGYSIYTGVGYEFARHWGVAMELGYTNFEMGGDVERWWDYDGVDLRVLVSLTGY